MKKFLALALAALMVGLTGCMAGPKGGTAQIQVSVGGEPRTLDPQMAVLPADIAYVSNLFDPLLTYGGVNGATIEQGAAESYIVTTHEAEDGATYPAYVFTMRQKGVWSDGEAVTADDFVYAFERIVDPEVGSPYAHSIGAFLYNGMAILNGEASIDQLGVISQEEGAKLMVILQSPIDFALELFAHSATSPVRRDLFAAHGDAWLSDPERWVSNGIYTLSAWDRGSQLTMERSKQHWIQAYTRNQTITWRFEESEARRVAGMENGELLLALGCPSELDQGARSAGTMHILPRYGTFAVYLNQNTAPMDDAKVREAFALAIDSQAIASQALSGAVQIAPRALYTGPSPSGSGDAVAPVATEARAAMAKEALREAGHPNGSGLEPVTYGYLQGDNNRLVAEALAAMWKDTLGVEVTLKAYSSADYPGVGGEDALVGVDLLAGYDGPYGVLLQFAQVAGEAFEGHLAAAHPYAQGESDEALGLAQAALLESYQVEPVYIRPGRLMYQGSVQGIRMGRFGQLYLESAERIEEGK